MTLSLLHQSCSIGDLEQVKEYLNNDNINEIEIILEEIFDNQWTIIERKELTPLRCAIENNHLTIVKYLYEQGANIYLLQ
jgi:ankyrin repeat protein